MLRQVSLPADIPGALFLYHMPGRYDSFEADSALIQAQQIDYVLCLAPIEEIRRKSPAYADAIERKNIAWQRIEFPISDFSAPGEDEEPAFLDLVRQVADDLRSGQRVLIHCAGGIGRTGTAAVCVLLALGFTQEVAIRCIQKAGSHHEAHEQLELIDWIAARIKTTQTEK